MCHEQNKSKASLCHGIALPSCRYDKVLLCYWGGGRISEARFYADL
tara:strand:- start:258 stop:395 length:138 start_codon:yes stop_codon:yes gene_type:complete